MLVLLGLTNIMKISGSLFTTFYFMVSSTTILVLETTSDFLKISVKKILQIWKVLSMYFFQKNIRN